MRIKIRLLLTCLLLLLMIGCGNASTQGLELTEENGKQEVVNKLGDVVQNLNQEELDQIQAYIEKRIPRGVPEVDDESVFGYLNGKEYTVDTDLSNDILYSIAPYFGRTDWYFDEYKSIRFGRFILKLMDADLYILDAKNLSFERIIHDVGYDYDRLSIYGEFMVLASDETLKIFNKECEEVLAYDNVWVPESGVSYDFKEKSLVMYTRNTKEYFKIYLQESGIVVENLRFNTAEYSKWFKKNMYYMETYINGFAVFSTYDFEHQSVRFDFYDLNDLINFGFSENLKPQKMVFSPVPYEDIYAGSRSAYEKAPKDMLGLAEGWPLSLLFIDDKVFDGSYFKIDGDEIYCDFNEEEFVVNLEKHKKTLLIRGDSIKEYPYLEYEDLITSEYMSYDQRYSNAIIFTDGDKHYIKANHDFYEILEGDNAYFDPVLKIAASWRDQRVEIRNLINETQNTCSLEQPIDKVVGVWKNDHFLYMSDDNLYYYNGETSKMIIKDIENQLSFELGMSIHNDIAFWGNRNTVQFFSHGELIYEKNLDEAQSLALDLVNLEWLYITEDGNLYLYSMVNDTEKLIAEKASEILNFYGERDFYIKMKTGETMYFDGKMQTLIPAN